MANRSMAGAYKDGAGCAPLRRVDPTEELWTLVRRVSEHFRDTDAPLGVEADRLLDFYGRQELPADEQKYREGE